MGLILYYVVQYSTVAYFFAALLSENYTGGVKENYTGQSCNRRPALISLYCWGAQMIPY